MIDDRRSVEELLDRGDAVLAFSLEPTGADGWPRFPGAGAAWAGFPLFADGQPHGWDCRILLDGVDQLRPDTSYVCPILYLSPTDATAALPVGTSVSLWMNRTVGTGQIVAAHGSRLAEAGQHPPRGE